MKKRIIKYLRKDNERSQRIVYNQLISIITKGGSIAVGLLLIPLTINYINTVQYGIWLTISSMITWLSFFDIGMGNGLRNRLTNSFALENYDEAQIYVSTTYATLAIVSSILFVSLMFINPYIDWVYFFNIPPSITTNIHFLIYIVISAFCLQLVVQLINTVLTAVHQSAMVSIISFIGQAFTLISIFILQKCTKSDFYLLVYTVLFIPLVVFIIVSIVLFRGKYKYLSPTIKKINFKYAKHIFNNGLSFFIIQIGALILFQTDNIIITKLLGPQYVTEFNIAYKFFSIVIMAFNIVITPYWSAFTDAYAKGDFEWMSKNIKMMRKYYIVFAFSSVLLYFISPFLYKLWLGDNVSVDNKLSVAMVIYMLSFMWQTIHVSFLNGIGKIKLQLILVVISATINIPLAIYLGNTFGLAGIISANTIVFIIMGIVFYIQSEKHLSQNANGIWLL